MITMKTLLSSIKFTLIAAILLFAGYVLVLWAFAAIVRPSHGQAELVTVDGLVRGAANVGQNFSRDIYFWGRPSAVGYDGSGSGGSNDGPSSKEYLDKVEQRMQTFLKAHPYLDRAEVPSEMVTASGSGLDPHISPRSAEIQTRRVARARDLPQSSVAALVASQTRRPIFGPAYVNVLKLNAALDSVR